jgi:hypothetical protein
MALVVFEASQPTFPAVSSKGHDILNFAKLITRHSGRQKLSLGGGVVSRGREHECGLV